MKESKRGKKSADLFIKNLPPGFIFPNDGVGPRMLREYGAMFVARGVTPPKTVVFRDEAEVAVFQSSVQISAEIIGGLTVELQTAAMEALKEAVRFAKQKNLSIRPRNRDAARRNYAGTVENWASRVNPGLSYWVGNGKLTQTEANRIKSLSPAEQIPEIFKLEEREIFFAKNNDKSIIYSVAPPGTSQHLSMLALDVAEFETTSVREILACHGWFQTVVSDLPHFTFLGVSESELSGLGLKKVLDDGRAFWLPDI
jgi:hypothetical protein